MKNFNPNYFGPLESKMNDNHDELGRFASGDAFHATSAGEAIRKDGFKIMEGSQGKLLGDAVYLAPQHSEAAMYGQEVLKVDTSQLKNIKTFKTEPHYKKWLAKSGVTNFDPPAVKDFMISKGHDAVIVADRTMAVFTPEKLRLK